MNEKDEALLSVLPVMYINEFTLVEVNRGLKPSQKRVYDLKMSLNEAREFRMVFKRYVMRTLTYPKTM